MSRKVLGRGLNALLGDEKSNNGEEYLEIDLDLIYPNSEQPRTRFSDELLEELAQSIRINGVVQAIIVRRQGDKFQIVAGEMWLLPFDFSRLFRQSFPALNQPFQLNFCML